MPKPQEFWFQNAMPLSPYQCHFIHGSLLWRRSLLPTLCLKFRKFELVRIHVSADGCRTHVQYFHSLQVMKILYNRHTIYGFHHQFICRDRLSDRRISRKSTHPLNETKFQPDIGPTKSTRVYDADTGSLVAMVVRDGCSNASAVSFVDEGIGEATNMRKTCQVSIIVYVYYSVRA